MGPVADFLSFMVRGPSDEEIALGPSHCSIVDSSLVFFGSGVFLQVIEVLVDKCQFLPPVTLFLKRGHEDCGELETLGLVYRQYTDRVYERRVGMLDLSVVSSCKGKHEAEEKSYFAGPESYPYRLVVGDCSADSGKVVMNNV